MTSPTEAASRVEAYLDSRARMRQLDPEEIASAASGEDHWPNRLLVSDLRALVSAARLLEDTETQVLD